MHPPARVLNFGVENTDSLVETTFLDGNRNLVGLQKIYQIWLKNYYFFHNIYLFTVKIA